MFCEIENILNWGEVPRGEKMLYSGTDPESYVTEYTLVYEDSTGASSGNTQLSTGASSSSSLLLSSLELSDAKVYEP